MVFQAFLHIVRGDSAVLLGQQLIEQLAPELHALVGVHRAVPHQVVGMGQNVVLRQQQPGRGGHGLHVEGPVLRRRQAVIVGHGSGRIHQPCDHLVHALKREQLSAQEIGRNAHARAVKNGIQAVGAHAQAVGVHAVADQLARLGGADDPGSIFLGLPDDQRVLQHKGTVIPVLPHIHKSVLGGFPQQRKGRALPFGGEMQELVARVQHHQVHKIRIRPFGDALHLRETVLIIL